jgi:NAD binding domain of 6-phosphogluconate dehydrogenase
MSSAPEPRVGFIGLGDQGAPMAQAIAGAGFELHAWARRPQSFDGLAGVAFVHQESPQPLATSHGPGEFSDRCRTGLLAALRRTSIKAMAQWGGLEYGRKGTIRAPRSRGWL